MTVKQNAVIIATDFSNAILLGPPLWSSGQSSWLQIQRSQVRFPVLPGFSEK
jgi:hypothetical protein